MAASTRRVRIEAMLADEPRDLFLRYSLALELQSEGEHTRSLALLDELTKESTPYVPAFFMAGKQLTGLGRVEDARAVLREGIKAARQQNEMHTAGEMSEYLTALGSHPD